MSEKILFCGDLVLPFGCKVGYEEVKALFEGKVAIANLEGAILPDESEVERYKWTDKFPHDELYARFAPIGTNGSILSQRKYTKIFLHELPLKDIVFHTRLFATRAEEIKSYILRRIFRFIRKTIIAIGLHHPYRQ